MLHLNLSTAISSLTCGFWICEAAAIDFSIPAGYQEPSLRILHTIWHQCCSDDGTWTIYLQWFPDRDKTPEYYSEMFFPLLPLLELHVIYPLLENLGSSIQCHHVPFQDFKLLLRTAGGGCTIVTVLASAQMQTLNQDTWFGCCNIGGLYHHTCFNLDPV